MNEYAPFTSKQTEYIKRTLSNWLNVAEGGKRGSKNIINALAFCINMENHPDKIHLAGGVSQSTAQLNIIDSNGLGVENYFYGRCKAGKYKDKACLYVQTKAGEKVILIAGGAKVSDPKYIKGFSLGSIYLTEVNECHKDFLKEAIDRTAASNNRKVFLDLNPKEPDHWFYNEFLKMHSDKQAEDSSYGFNYGHFNIYDNLSIETPQLNNVINTYDKSSVWFKRDILGERIAAEGLIYGQFANNNDSYILDRLPDNINGFITVGVDFGHSRSANTFNATLISNKFNEIITIKDYYIKKELNAEQLVEEFYRFILELKQEFPFRIYNVRADSAEPILIRTLQSGLLKKSMAIKVLPSIKNIITDRMRFYNVLISARRYKVLSSCKNTIKAFNNAVWDDSKSEDVRLDDTNLEFNPVDVLDSQEYSTEEFMSQIQDLVQLGV